MVCQYSWVFTPPGNWITTSLPMGSSNGATKCVVYLTQSRKINILLIVYFNSKCL